MPTTSPRRSRSARIIPVPQPRSRNLGRPADIRYRSINDMTIWRLALSYQNTRCTLSISRNRLSSTFHNFHQVNTCSRDDSYLSYNPQKVIPAPSCSNKSHMGQKPILPLLIYMISVFASLSLSFTMDEILTRYF